MQCPRSSLATALALAAAAPLFCPACSAPVEPARAATPGRPNPGPPPAPAVGLQLYSLRREMARDLTASLDSVAAWGIHHVEDGNDGTYGLPFAAYKGLLDARDIAMVSVSSPFEELRDSVANVVARARAYGAAYAVCFWIPHADTLLTPAEAEGAIEVFNRAGAVLADAGVTLAYHPHGYEFAPHPAGGTVLDELVRRSDHYDFEMDVYWIALPGQDPVEWLRRYPDEWVLMHLKDCDRAGRVPTLPHANDVEWNVTLGEGAFPIAEVVREARDLGIPYLFVEDESSRVLAQAGGSAAFVRGVLGAD